MKIKVLNKLADDLGGKTGMKYPNKYTRRIENNPPARHSVFRYIDLQAKLQLCNKTKFCKQRNEIL